MISWAKSFTSLGAEINQDITMEDFYLASVLMEYFLVGSPALLKKNSLSKCSIKTPSKKDTLLNIYVLMEICHHDSTDWALK